MDHISLLGPAASPSEHKVLTTEAGNMEVASMQERLRQHIEQKHKHLQYDLESLTKLQQEETEAFKVLQNRGLTLDIDVFTREMNTVIDNYQQQGKTTEAHQQTMRRDKILQLHPQTDVIHPTFSTQSSRTGRITVSKPALQSWKSTVRTALLPSAEDYDYIYSLDCKAYDPTVLGVLSKDENLLNDLRADDFYMKLLQQIGHEGTDENYRSAFKRLFLSCFINGGDVAYHLQKSALSLTRAQWQKIEDRYAVALKYRNDIEQTGVAYSLNGITYLFKSDDTAKFSKFIQHEAAYIFRHMFINVFKQEKALNMFILLPVHDEVLVAVKDAECVRKLREMMMTTFQEVTGQSILKVKMTAVRGEQNA